MKRGQYKTYYEGEFKLPKSTRYDAHILQSSDDESSDDEIQVIHTFLCISKYDTLYYYYFQKSFFRCFNIIIIIVPIIILYMLCMISFLY